MAKEQEAVLQREPCWSLTIASVVAQGGQAVCKIALSETVGSIPTQRMQEERFDSVTYLAKVRPDNRQTDRVYTIKESMV